MMNSAAGFLLLIVAGGMNASFTLPMKYARRWEWENTWLAWSILALVVLPPALALATVPHIAAVYDSAPRKVLLDVIGFGAGWGVAQVFFGLAVDAIGIALTFSIVLGTSAAVGSVIPLLHIRPEQLKTAEGLGVLAGLALVVTGVFLCAIAGKRRERSLQERASANGKMMMGLTLAILCGFGASFVNLGLTFGVPLIQSARFFGASTLTASNAVWMPLMTAGAIPNVLYCGWLLWRNRTSNRFRPGGLHHWSLALVMALFWFGSTVLYGIAAAEIGLWGPILGWPVFMSLIVITATVLGVLSGEWKDSGRTPLRFQWAGVLLLVLAVIVLAGTVRTPS